VDRLVVAVDLSAREDVLRTIDTLRGSVGVFKIGLQAFIANGPALVREIVANGDRVFLDLKIHDIPNTAKHAVGEVASLGVSIATVHAGGGSAMLSACVRDPLLVLGVTILTSLDEAELRGIGFDGAPLANAVRLAKLVRGAGLPGVVASPQEIEAIRSECGEGFVILTPGIRPAGSDAGDQRRTMTPREAVAAGADYLVVGRPITSAADPRSAALRIVGEMR
jgi:orotidine-5'-phosphate decarboxylase